MPGWENQEDELMKSITPSRGFWGYNRETDKNSDAHLIILRTFVAFTMRIPWSFSAGPKCIRAWHDNILPWDISKCFSSTRVLYWFTLRFHPALIFSTRVTNQTTYFVICVPVSVILIQALFSQHNPKQKINLLFRMCRKFSWIRES